MTLVHYIVDLEEIYSSDFRFSEKRIKEFVQLGLEKILKIIEKEPILFQHIKWKNNLIKEIMGGRHGCEYVRALYELGIRKFPMLEDKIKLYEIRYAPIKLKDVPLISEKEYEEYDKSLEDGLYAYLFMMETTNKN